MPGEVPLGAIIDWFPPPGASAPPAGYVLCDGRKITVRGPFENQTAPDLNDRFVYGTVTLAEAGKPGGTPTVSVPIGNHAHRLRRGAHGGLDLKAGGDRVELHTSALDDCVSALTEDAGGTTATVDHLPPFVKLVKIMRVQ